MLRLASEKELANLKARFIRNQGCHHGDCARTSVSVRLMNVAATGHVNVLSVGMTETH